MGEKSAEYREGYEQGVKDMAERLEKYYTSFTGKTMSAAVAYAIKITAEELLKDIPIKKEN